MDCFKYHIKNVWVIAGDGSEPVKSEVLVAADGTILACGKSFTGCGKVIDGGKLLLCPGFIDAHGHSDISVLAYPDGFSKVSQGVTTEIAGNCGLSAFPLTDNNREHLEELYRNYNVQLQWHDFAGYRKNQQIKGCVPDVIPLCGHNTLRAAVAGYEKKTLSPEDMNRMKELLSAALDAGAPGLSAGLLYVPGKFASDGEIIELMKIIASKNKIFTTHLRSEGDQLLESLGNTLFLAENAGLKKLQISHFKTAGAANWNKLSAAIELIAEARYRGIDVTVDRYPYVESMTQMSVILPGAWSDMDDVSIERKLRDPEERKHLAELLRSERNSEYWKRVRLASTGSGRYRKYCGMLLPDIADDPVELVVELMSQDASGTCGAFAGMNEENLKRIMHLEFCMPGSDGNAFSAGYRGGAHPRSYGTVPRFLKMLLEDGLSPGHAVRRATGLPALTFGLDDRGLVAAGRRADLVLLDPDELTDNADFASPYSVASGIKFTMLNGSFVFRN